MGRTSRSKRDLEGSARLLSHTSAATGLLNQHSTAATSHPSAGSQHTAAARCASGGTGSSDPEPPHKILCCHKITVPKYFVRQVQTIQSLTVWWNHTATPRTRTISHAMTTQAALSTTPLAGCLAPQCKVLRIAGHTAPDRRSHRPKAKPQMSARLASCRRRTSSLPRGTKTLKRSTHTHTSSGGARDAYAPPTYRNNTSGAQRLACTHVGAQPHVGTAHAGGGAAKGPPVPPPPSPQRRALRLGGSRGIVMLRPLAIASSKFLGGFEKPIRS